MQTSLHQTCPRQRTSPLVRIRPPPALIQPIFRVLIPIAACKRSPGTLIEASLHACIQPMYRPGAHLACLNRAQTTPAAAANGGSCCPQHPRGSSPPLPPHKKHSAREHGVVGSPGGPAAAGWTARRPSAAMRRSCRKMGPMPPNSPSSRAAARPASARAAAAAADGPAQQGSGRARWVVSRAHSTPP